MAAEESWIETNLPARLDRLPWSRWHWLVVSALGITWVLDGLEVTLAGALGGILTRPEALALSDVQVGGSAAAYLSGAVLGSLLFGYATDRYGRKKLFYFTLALYLVATAATAFSWNFASYALFRALTGAGIGGEYSAINSAIDELIPARIRGRVDLTINSTFWVGAALGSGATVWLLSPAHVPLWLGWRLAFGLGAALGLIVLFLRHWVPESPRWLVVHGQAPAAEKIVAEVEQKIVAETNRPLPPPADQPIHLRVRRQTPWAEIWHAIVHEHRSRSVLGAILMISQAFFFNGAFFTYSLVLVRFYGVPEITVGGYLLPFALGNVLGPIVLGPLFDRVGRKPMIAATYILSGLLLAVSAWLFDIHALTATTQTLVWMVIFFVASAAASSAYLTVSEIFPLEIRGLAIAIFYSVGTLIGGVGAPILYGHLIAESVKVGVRSPLSEGYLIGSTVMIIAGVVEVFLGVKAERKSLESIASPLAARSHAATSNSRGG